MHEVSEDANDEEDDVWDGGKIIFIVMSLFFPLSFNLPSVAWGSHHVNEKCGNLTKKLHQPHPIHKHFDNS